MPPPKPPWFGPERPSPALALARACRNVPAPLSELFVTVMVFARALETVAQNSATPKRVSRLTRVDLFAGSSLFIIIAFILQCEIPRRMLQGKSARLEARFRIGKEGFLPGGSFGWLRLNQRPGFAQQNVGN